MPINGRLDDRQSIICAAIRTIIIKSHSIAPAAAESSALLVIHHVVLFYVIVWIDNFQQQQQQQLGLIGAVVVVGVKYRQPFVLSKTVKLEFLSHALRHTRRRERP